MNSIVQSIVEGLSGKISKELIVFIVSMIPILELRGSILAAGFLDGMKFLPTYIAAVLGNMLPIPFILLFIEKIFSAMKKTKHLNKIPVFLEKKALSKSEQIEKYGYLGLFLFVAIPLPGTGAWTGSLLAVLLGLNLKKSFLFVFLGVMTAGLIMSLLSFGILQNIF
ncbi:MAG: small multi-drug export protein [Oscillospiraceae bacterium]|nr:small multi-drug export protein [Oscillospiraceae bacterium]